MTNSMMYVTTTWNKKPSFRLIPITDTCPYIECIFDAEAKVLVVVSKLKKDQFHMIPKLDDNGDIVQRRIKTSPEDNPFKQERKLIETYQEYYIIDKREILDFLDMAVENKNNAGYKQVASMFEEPTAKLEIVTP
jgi:hypothetical protein